MLHKQHWLELLLLLDAVVLLLGGPLKIQSEDDPSDDRPESARNSRRISVRRQMPSYPNILYPQIHFFANGKPGKIYVNNWEYVGEPTTTTERPVSKADDIVVADLETTTATAAPPLPINPSPITWITSQFPFNGIPANLFYIPAPAAHIPGAPSPISWIGSSFGGVGSAVKSIFGHSMMPASIYLG